ncbi:hypothetical protein L9F63_010808, partial [Diploptera punctata]
GYVDGDHKPLKESLTVGSDMSVVSSEGKRRSSHSWKGFSLKKQLSRVDQKFKNTFSASSQQSSMTPIEIDSPSESLPEDSRETSPTDDEQCSGHRIFRGKEPGEITTSTKLHRPVDLPLFDEDGHPVRPPRNESKKKSMEKPVAKRDIRLLSVPNIKYSKHEHLLRDLRGKDAASTNQPSLGNLMRRFNKLDSSFSRSRSSSMSSLENISSEAIQCLAFADSYTKKSDPSMFPTLWIGTSLGSVLTVMINVPPAGESRLQQPVIVSPIGTIFRLKGCILTMSFLDCNGALIPYSYEAWRDENKEGRDRISKDAVAQIRTSTPST